MSGTNPFGSDVPTAPTHIQIPVPDDPETMNAQRPEILQQVLSHIQVLERAVQVTQPERINEISGHVSQISQAQFTMQQSLNLLQSAHNTLHENWQQRSTSTMGDDKRKKVMDAKL